MNGLYLVVLLLERVEEAHVDAVVGEGPEGVKVNLLLVLLLLVLLLFFILFPGGGLVFLAILFVGFALGRPLVRTAPELAVVAKGIAEATLESGSPSSCGSGGAELGRGGKTAALIEAAAAAPRKPLRRSSLWCVIQSISDSLSLDIHGIEICIN